LLHVPENLVKSVKTLVLAPEQMYRKVESTPTPPSKFELPFEGKLSQDNRWVIMAGLVPWEEFEQEYAQNFSLEMGAPALPFRVALGSLIIKEKLGISDRETVEQIKENPRESSLLQRKRNQNQWTASRKTPSQYQPRLEETSPRRRENS
jgi:hypothetical protein